MHLPLQLSGTTIKVEHMAVPDVGWPMNGSLLGLQS
jgi:hypothetical protein